MITNQKTSGNKGTNSGFQLSEIEIAKKHFNRLTATGGSFYTDLGFSGKFPQKIYAFVAQGDTIISMLSAGPNKDELSNYLTIMGIGGKTLKQGALIVFEDGIFVDSMTVSTGSVIAYMLKVY